MLSENLLGGNRKADYRAIPRVVYTHPPMASVGRSAEQAGAAGIEVITASTDLSGLARVNTDGAPGGRLILVADRAREVLVGAAGVGPGAGDWISEASVAIRASVSLRRCSPTLCVRSRPSPRATRSPCASWPRSSTAPEFHQLAASFPADRWSSSIRDVSRPAPTTPNR